MKPVYFPFTYVGETMADALAACFRQFVLYQPTDKPLPPHMLKLVQRDILEIRVPIRHDRQVIEGVMRDYRAWAKLQHGGSGLKSLFLNYLGDAIPFYSDTSPSRIISEVKRADQNSSHGMPPDPLLRAVVFLEFAQEFDRQTEEIYQDLKASDITTRELISNLLGEQAAAELASGGGGPQASIEYMILERMVAWTQLLCRDPVVAGLLITSSRSLLEHMLDQLPSAEPVFQNDSIPIGVLGAGSARAWQDELGSRLSGVLDLEGDTVVDFSSTISVDRGSGPRVSLRIYRIPGQAPVEVLTACNRPPVVQPTNLQTAVTARNTLLGHIALHP